MHDIETINARRFEGQVTIWLPVQWPVATLSVMEVGAHELLWQIAHDTFHGIEATEKLEIRINRISLETSQDRRADEEISGDQRSVLRYGDVPEGMKQLTPTYGPPQPLVDGVRYLILVRDWPDYRKSRRFAVRVI